MSKKASDGTREYHPHSSHNAAGFTGLNSAVYEGLAKKAFYPGLMFSGEVARPDKNGRPVYNDDVVRKQVEMREEMPYG